MQVYYYCSHQAAIAGLLLLAVLAIVQLSVPVSSGILRTSSQALTRGTFDESNKAPGSSEKNEARERAVQAEQENKLDASQEVEEDEVPVFAPGGDFFEYDFMRRYRQLRSRFHGDEEPPSSAKSNKFRADEVPTPVLLVPGYGGSRLEVRRNKSQVKHYFCEKRSDWANVWIDLKLMLPYMIDCLIEDFRLEFDPQTNRTRNTQGVEMRVREPDELANVEFLTDIHLSSFGYFSAIIRKLTHTHNYRRDVNIRGAPYDFRKAPNELGEYFDKMRRDVEQMVEQSRGKRLTFICHSMGCNNVLYFLQRQPANWKEAHVMRVISLAAPWGGSMQAVRATAFGDNLGLPYLFDESELKIVQQSVPSTMYLFPSERVFKDAPLITVHHSSRPRQRDGEASVSVSKSVSKATSRQNPFLQLLKDDLEQGSQDHTTSPLTEVLRVRDFKRFFELINHPAGYAMWLNTRELLNELKAPGVEVWCLYGKGHSTMGRLEVRGAFNSASAEDIHDDGDGTVTVESATFCKQWAHEQKQPVHLKSFYANHVGMMRDVDVLEALESIISDHQPERLEQ